MKPLDLGTLYGLGGIFGDSRGQDRIPDETETVIVLGSEAGDALAVIDLAARVALETTGLSLPLAVVEDEVEDLRDFPTRFSSARGASAARSDGTAPWSPGRDALRFCRRRSVRFRPSW